MNAQIGKNENKFREHNLQDRNVEYQADFSPEKKVNMP